VRLRIRWHAGAPFGVAFPGSFAFEGMDEVIAVTRAARGFVMLHEADGMLVFRAAHGMDQQTIDDPQFQVSRGVVERVAREGQPILTSDAQSDDRFSMRQSVMVLGLRSILCVP